MIDEGALELRNVIARLETATANLGLMPAEICRILLREGRRWPMPAVEQWSSMSKCQETRIRDLAEVCVRLEGVFGPDAMSWLRRSSPLAGLAPVAFLMSDPDALGALRDILRLEEGATRHG